jgi:hypothetical protein
LSKAGTKSLRVNLAEKMLRWFTKRQKMRRRFSIMLCCMH